MCYGSLRSQGTWAELCDHQLVAEWRDEVSLLHTVASRCSVIVLEALQRWHGLRARRRPEARAADLRNAAQYRERDHVILFFCSSFFSLCLLVPIGVPSLRIPGIEFPRQHRNKHQTSFGPTLFPVIGLPPFLETNVFWKNLFFRCVFQKSFHCFSPKFDGDRPERVSPSPTVAPRPTASGGVRDTVLSEPVAAPWPEATVQDRRFVERMTHRVRPRPARHPNKSRALPVLVWDQPRKDRNRLDRAVTGNSAAQSLPL